MTRDFNQAFDTLLGDWKAYDDLRRQNAPIGQLMESRSRLMKARVEVARARRSL